MLARYQMKRGAPASSLPAGVRQDTRKHTKHVLRPPAPLVADYLADPSDARFASFREGYRAAVRERLESERPRFDELAELARHERVHLGCSCPTKKNPSVRRCHTWLALELMAELYPDLEVTFPEDAVG